MQNLFNKVVNDISTTAERVNIPILKSKRDDHEAERDKLVSEIEKLIHYERTMRGVVEILAENRRSNVKALEDLNAYFITQQYIPFPDPDNLPLAPNEALRNLNATYISFMTLNCELDQRINEFNGSKIPQLQAKVNELEVEISKLNNQLRQIRSGSKR
jgi:hypothetical protein|eukprot:gene922-664_t